MKIDRDKRGLNNFSAVTRKNQVEVPRKESATFNDELYQRQEAEGRFRMQELLGEMDHLTERLNKSLTVNDLMLYKKLVKQFLQEATSKAYNLNQQSGRSRRGRSILITIKTVDQEMEQLLDDFIRQKSDPVEVLETLDKIRGMLIDLMA